MKYPNSGLSTFLDRKLLANGHTWGHKGDSVLKGDKKLIKL